MGFLTGYKHVIISETMHLSPLSDCLLIHSYRQAQATVLEALPLLNQLSIATKRPDDYFAEMAKSDQQMQKVSVSASCLGLK